MPKPPEPPTSQRRLVSFTMKLNLAESSFVEDLKEKTGLPAAEIVRGFLNAFRNWFDLPAYMAAELRKQMEERGLNERQYFSELLAREYERSVHGDGKGRQGARSQ